MTKLVFNTNRPYTPKGQTIHCLNLGIDKDELLETVFFKDISRGVEGIVHVFEFKEDSIVSAYDKGGYGSKYDLNEDQRAKVTVFEESIA
jgi:hypothetical protein